MPIPGVQHHWPIDVGHRDVVLADGSRAVVRALGNRDVVSVQEVFDGMSDASRGQRFLSAKPRLTPRDLEVLTAVDHENQAAYVAVDPTTGRAVGEARLVRDAKNPGVGEVAFAIADGWQNRRLGTRLAEFLASRARELGIRRLRATMLPGNARSAALVRGMGRVVSRGYDGGALEIEVAL